MDSSSPGIHFLLHRAGGDLFAARIGLYNLSAVEAGSTFDASHQAQIAKLSALLDQTADSLLKLTQEFNQQNHIESV